MEKARARDHEARLAWLRKMKAREDADMEAKLHTITIGTDELSLANGLLSTKEQQHIKRKRNLYKEWQQKVYMPISARVRSKCSKADIQRRKGIRRTLHDAYLTHQDIPIGMERELDVKYSIRGIRDPIKSRTRFNPKFKVRRTIPAREWTTRDHFPAAKDQIILRRLLSAPCPRYTPCNEQDTQPVHYGTVSKTQPVYQSLVKKQYFPGGLRKFPGEQKRRNPLCLGLPEEKF